MRKILLLATALLVAGEPAFAGRKASKCPSALGITQIPNAKIVLQTKRLTLKPLSKQDLDQVAAIAAQNKVREPLGYGGYKEHEIRSKLEYAVRHFAEGYRYVVLFGIWHEDTLVGFIKSEQEDEYWPALDSFDFPYRRGEGNWFSVSYAVDPEHWGNGYTLEALIRLIQFLFEERAADGIHGQTLASNKFSARVLEKAGFKKAKAWDGVNHFLLTE